jgi:RNA polymerase sigma factor (sigma-70 family)
MDEELRQILRQDFERGFECLVSAYQHRLCAFGLSLAGAPEDGEEIAQDALVRAYKALAGYPAERLAELRPGPWLYRIALNVFRNRVRRRQLATVPWEDGVAATARAGPEQEAERAEDRRQLVELLARLPAGHREAVVLRHVQGLSYAEAADALGQPVGTVKANVSRGLARLRRAIGERRT